MAAPTLATTTASVTHTAQADRRTIPWGALAPVIFVLIFLAVPLLALFLYSFAQGWGTTVLPTSYTLDHWITALTSNDVIAAVGRSLFLTAVVCAINWVLVVPAAYVSVAVDPRVRKLLHMMAIVPFALPWVVIAAGMQISVGEFAPSLFATVPLLIFCMCAVTFPYLYWSVENSFITNNVKQLSEAALMCGAGTMRVLAVIVVPAARKGIMTGSLLMASAVFGELAITQVLIGGSFETLPLWTLRVFAGRSPSSGAVLAAVSFATFALLFAISLALTAIDRDTSNAEKKASSKIGSR